MNIGLFERLKHQIGISNEPVAFENITDEFITNYCNYVVEFISRENGVAVEEVFENAKHGIFDLTKVTKRTELFLDWLSTTGEKHFKEITGRLEISNLSDKVYAFARLYNHILQKAINCNNIEMLLDNLYFIPGEMFREYNQFGFLKNINLHSILLFSAYMNYFKARLNHFDCCLAYLLYTRRI